MPIAPPMVNQHLHAERERLRRELALAADAQRASVDEEAATSPDDGSLTFNKELTASIESDLQQLLGQVEHAIHKLEHGTYGTCDDCGQPIAAARLEALPYVALCINCKQRVEHSHRTARRAA